MPIYHKIAQRSKEWYALRLGKPTASEFGRILTPTGKPSSQAEQYLYRLLAERVTGQSFEEEDYESAYMVRGQETEDAAISAYEFVTGVETEPGGFVTTDDTRIGCSPDRLISRSGILETKCPKCNNHIGYLLQGSIEAKYIPQTQGQIWITERDYVDVCSYHPKMPPAIIREQRNDSYIKNLSAAVTAFCDKLDEAYALLERKYGPFVRPEPAPPVAEPDMGVTDADAEEIWAAYAKSQAAFEER